MKAYIQLGKSGDVISILPCLHQDFKETGEKSALIISRKYAHVLEGCDYLEPVVYAGEWNDVSGALRSAKLHYPEVMLPQMHASDYVPRRQYPSFQLDQWARCGRLSQWGMLPLVYPRNTQKIESKIILFGDHSESSPFPHADDLHAALMAEFPTHRIVRLSSVKLPHLSDLLALYDESDLLVSIDTLHAHLSLATKTPVIILATDRPSRWHGTAFHPRMAAHIRYGDYLVKKDQLLQVARQCVNKSAMPVVTNYGTVKEYGYNLSMMQVGNNVWKTYRWHPTRSWRTEMALVAENKHVEIKPPAKYEKHSIEDGRLFMFRGKPHISLTVARSRQSGQRSDPCIQAYGELKPDGSIINWVEPKIGKNDWSSCEKNWCFWEFNGKLHVTYSHSPAHVVYELNDTGAIVHEFRTAVPTCNYGEPRGGTQFVSHGKEWLKFFHTNQVNPKSDAKQNYHVGAMTVEPGPPFRIKKISTFPVISGNELWNDAPHWKAKCALPYGLIRNGDCLEVSLGLNDCQCAIAYVWPENLNLS